MSLSHNELTRWDLVTNMVFVHSTAPYNNFRAASLEGHCHNFALCVINSSLCMIRIVYTIQDSSYYVLTRRPRMTHTSLSGQSSLVQIMACRLIGAKSLSKTIRTYCWLVNWIIGNKFQGNFHRNTPVFIKEINLNCHLQNGGHLLWGSIYLTAPSYYLNQCGITHQRDPRGTCIKYFKRSSMINMNFKLIKWQQLFPMRQETITLGLYQEYTASHGEEYFVVWA